MTESEAIRALVVLLAGVGYYHFLTRYLFVTLVVSAGFAAYFSQRFPFDMDHLPYWVAVAGVVTALAVLARVRHPKPRSGRAKEMGPAQGRQTAVPGQGDIVIDGTNVLYWDGDGADMATLRAVVHTLRNRGFAPYVFLDASSRHHLGNTSLNEKGFAKELGLTRDRVMVCPAQTEADAFILKFAQDYGLPVVSNDRFNDRAAQAKGLKLIKGVMAAGKPILQGF